MRANVEDDESRCKDNVCLQMSKIAKARFRRLKPGRWQMAVPPRVTQSLDTVQWSLKVEIGNYAVSAAPPKFGWMTGYAPPANLRPLSALFGVPIF